MAHSALDFPGLPGVPGRSKFATLVTFGCETHGNGTLDYLLFNSSATGGDPLAWTDAQGPLPAAFTYRAVDSSTQLDLVGNFVAASNNPGVSSRVTVYTGPPTFPATASASVSVIMTAPIDRHTLSFLIPKGNLVWVSYVALNPPNPTLNASLQLHLS
jgi:hypothetical protein